jgi:TP901 family phage tail tape measure protein
MAERQIDSKIVFSAIDRVSGTVKNIANGITPLQRRIESVSKSMQDWGGLTMIKSGAGLIGMFTGIVQPAIRFEEAMSDVFKVMDLKAFNTNTADFSKHVRDISKELGLSAIDMASIYQNMPVQSVKGDIQALDTLATMTRQSMVTAEMSASDAGDAIKTFFNTLGRDVGRTQKAIDQVNELGNSFAISNNKILEFSRMGGLAQGESLGISTGQTLAMGASMLAIGATPERAYTSFQHLTNALSKNDTATKSQIASFKKLGTTSEQMTKKFLIDPKKTIFEIFERIQKLPEAQRGGVFAKIFGLEGLGNIKGLSKNIPLLMEAFNKTDSVNVLGSNQREYEKKMNTTLRRYQAMMSKINDLQIQIGTMLLPSVIKVMEAISSFAEKFDNLDDSTKNAIGTVAIATTGMLAFGVAIGGVSYAMGGLLGGLSAMSKFSGLLGGGIMSMFGGKKTSKAGKLNSVIGAKKTINRRSKVIEKGFFTDMFMLPKGKQIGLNPLKRDFGIIGNTIARLTTGFYALGGSLIALSAPLLPIIAGFTALIGIGYAVYKRWDEVKASLVQVGEAFSILADSFGIDGSAIGDTCMMVGDFISKYIGDAVLLVIDGIKALVLNIAGIKNAFSYLLGSKEFSSIGNAFNAPMDKYNAMQAQKQAKADAERYSSVAYKSANQNSYQDKNQKFDFNSTIRLQNPDGTTQSVVHNKAKLDSGSNSPTQSKSILRQGFGL